MYETRRGSVTFINSFPFMSFSNVTLFVRITGPLATSGLAYVFWLYIKNRHGSEGQQNALLIVTYTASRLGLWLLFAIYMQNYVTTSDPRLFYIPILDHVLARDIPIRDFFYPWGPFLILSMLPFYLLLGHS